MPQVGHQASALFLICRCESRLCALRLEHVAETIRPLPINPVPATPPFLLGVAIIRGAAVPVVSMAKLVGAAADPSPARFVTVKVGERQVAFAVESVIGVRELSAQSAAQIPPLLQDVDAGGLAAITTLDAELLLVLQGTRIIPGSVWEALDCQVPPT